MKSPDPFTLRRLLRFIDTVRTGTGVLPTLNDLRANGFDDELIKGALKSQVIEEFYVTLTNGVIVKGYKAK